MANRISDEKAREHSRNIIETARDVTIEDAVNETRRVIRKYRVNTDNETLATIALDSFCDYLEACDVPGAADLFAAHFPEWVSL